jgi:hypothetical protein
MEGKQDGEEGCLVFPGFREQRSRERNDATVARTRILKAIGFEMSVKIMLALAPFSMKSITCTGSYPFKHISAALITGTHSSESPQAGKRRGSGNSRRKAFLPCEFLD